MGSEIEHYNAHQPEHTGRASFLALAFRMATLTGAALELKEGLNALQRRMGADADEADRIAEQAGAAEVEERFTALIHEAALSLRAVAEASGELAGAADAMEAHARETSQAHQSEYRGIYEAVNARPDVRQAKPGFYRTR
ncbi:conjugal transfer protein TraB [Streptomyces sp. GSL17-111]|uniref:conjugal transfer protein TraB n=1 Tax=Streptomyces sp. GSL17-111 TaxID=3121596 RepID=UPI0030F4536B